MFPLCSILCHHFFFPSRTSLILGFLPHVLIPVWLLLLNPITGFSQLSLGYGHSLEVPCRISINILPISLLCSFAPMVSDPFYILMTSESRPSAQVPLLTSRAPHLTFSCTSPHQCLTYAFSSTHSKCLSLSLSHSSVNDIIIYSFAQVRNLELILDSSLSLVLQIQHSSSTCLAYPESISFFPISLPLPCLNYWHRLLNSLSAYNLAFPTIPPIYFWYHNSEL